MTSRIDVFSLAVSRVVSGALVEAADLQNMDDDLSLEEARVRAVETIVEELRIDIQEALGLLRVLVNIEADPTLAALHLDMNVQIAAVKFRRQCSGQFFCFCY